MNNANPGAAILSLQNIVRSYGAQPVLNGVSLAIHEGDRLGLIGRNGSGKSTLLRIAAGLDQPDAGLVTRMQGLRVSLLGQSCGLPRGRTVRETLEASATPVRALLKAYHEAADALGKASPADAGYPALQEQVAQLTHQMEVVGAWDFPTEVKRLSTGLDLPHEDRALASLSGGELRRVDLAVRILERPDLLLLDEPTNHIDTRSVEWVERFLEGYRGACILVTHDRYFLDRVVTRIVELENSRTYSFPGSYAAFLEYKSGVEQTREQEESSRRGVLRRELEWLRRGPKARGTKQKARIQRIETLQEQGPPPRRPEFEFAIPQPSRLSKTVLLARGVRHGYEDNTLVKHFEVIMQQGMRVGVIGPNGCGKTTLLRILMGLEEPRRGKVVIGETTVFLYVDQAHEEANPAQTVLDFVSNGQRFWDVGQRRIFVPSYLEKFLFDQKAVLAPLGNLSGGERNRLDIARKLLRGGNFLVLDEPTNDLDLYTLRVLEEAITGFDGCALIVSHDRYFLNRVCTHMWVFEGGGEITQLVGNYDDVLLHRERRAAAEKEAAAADSAGGKAVRPPERRPETGRKRLTYMEKRELAEMEKRVMEAEAEAARLDALVSSPDFYKGSAGDIRDTLDALAQARAEVEAVYARWQELESRA